MRRILSKIWSTALLFSTFIMIAAFQNCGGQSVHNQSELSSNLTGSINVNGTVQKSTLDGCNYLISAVDNSTGQVQQFIPKDMDPSLLIPGNQVSVTGTIVTDEVNDCMAGSMIQVQEASLISSN
jgi:hypothetical protein